MPPKKKQELGPASLIGKQVVMSHKYKEDKITGKLVSVDPVFMGLEIDDAIIYWNVANIDAIKESK